MNSNILVLNNQKEGDKWTNSVSSVSLAFYDIIHVCVSGGQKC